MFLPLIDFNGEYQIGLVDFQSNDSVYNVNEPDNVLYHHEQKKVTLMIGNTTTNLT